MKLRYRESSCRRSTIGVFKMTMTKLHDLIMSSECGILEFKTDFLHDLAYIIEKLTVLEMESKFAGEYAFRTVIGTRECGTFNADDEEDFKDWKSSAIAYVGVEVASKHAFQGMEYTVSHYTMAESEVKHFLKHGDTPMVSWEERMGKLLLDYGAVQLPYSEKYKYTYSEDAKPVFSQLEMLELFAADSTFNNYQATVRSAVEQTKDENIDRVLCEMLDAFAPILDGSTTPSEHVDFLIELYQWLTDNVKIEINFSTIINSELL